jgi:hypothetical protein
MPTFHRALSFVLALAAVAAPVTAGEKRVVIGEVSSQVVRSGFDYESLLRAASEDELRTLDLSRVPSGKRVIVSVALVRLDTLAQPSGADTTCVVNATLRDARAGTVFAMLEGKARASGAGAGGTVERSVMQGALHGALGRIPEVLRH